TLASQVAAVIERARLFEETSRRAGEFQTLYAMSRAISLQQDTASLLDTIVARATELLQSAAGGIYLYDAEQGELRSTVRRGVNGNTEIRWKMGEGGAGRVALTRQALIIDDYQTWEGRSPQYEGVPFRAILQVPMLYGGELIGVLAVDEYGEDVKRKFTEADARLLSLFAVQAAGAIYNARLFEETRLRADQFAS